MTLSTVNSLRRRRAADVNRLMEESRRGRVTAPSTGLLPTGEKPLSIQVYNDTLNRLKTYLTPEGKYNVVQAYKNRFEKYLLEGVFGKEYIKQVEDYIDLEKAFEPYRTEGGYKLPDADELAKAGITDEQINKFFGEEALKRVRLTRLPAYLKESPESTGKLAPSEEYISKIPVPPAETPANTQSTEVPFNPPVYMPPAGGYVNTTTPPPAQTPVRPTGNEGYPPSADEYIKKVPVPPPPEKLDDKVRGMIDEMMALKDAGEETIITTEEAAEHGIIINEGFKVRGYGENSITMFSIIDDLGNEYRLDGTVWGPDGEEIDYGEEEEPGLNEIKDDLQILFPGSSEESISYLVENLENTWFQDVVIRQIKKAGRNEMTESILRAMGADEAGLNEFFRLLEATEPEPEIVKLEPPITPVSDTVTAGMTLPYLTTEQENTSGPEPKQMSLDEYIGIRLGEDQIPISSIDFSSSENAMFLSPAMRKRTLGMEEEYQKWVRQTDAIAKYTEEYRRQVGEGTFTQQIGATIIGRNPLLPLPLLEKILQPGGSWEKAKNASIEEKIVTALTIAGLSAWALGKPLSILFGNARGALQEAKLAAEFKNTYFYKDLAPELRNSALERDIYNVYKIYRSGIKGATVEESDNIANQMMARIYNDVKAGRYGDFTYKIPQEPPTKPAQPVTTPQLGQGGETIKPLPTTPPSPQYTDPSRLEELSATDFEDDASRTKYIEILRQISEENLDALENQIIQVTGVEPAYVRTMSVKDLNKRINRSLGDGEDPREIPDVVTARIDVDEKDMYQYLEMIKEGFQFIDKNEYFDTPTNIKNRKINVFIKLPSGTLAQIQIYPRSPTTPQEITDEIALETGNKMADIYASVLDGKTTDEVIDNLKVSKKAAQLSNNKGVDVTGFTQDVKPDFYIHTRDNHGPGNETWEDQEPIREQDMRWVPEIMRNPDDIKLGNKSEDGNDTLIFIKKVDGTIYYLQIIGTQEKHLIAKTMWKKIK